METFSISELIVVCITLAAVIIVVLGLFLVLNELHKELEAGQEEKDKPGDYDKYL